MKANDLSILIFADTEKFSFFNECISWHDVPRECLLRLNFFCLLCWPEGKETAQGTTHLQNRIPSEETFEKSYDQTAERNIHENKPAQVRGKTANT